MSAAAQAAESAEAARLETAAWAGKFLQTAAANQFDADSLVVAADGYEFYLTVRETFAYRGIEYPAGELIQLANPHTLLHHLDLLVIEAIKKAGL